MSIQYHHKIENNSLQNEGSQKIIVCQLLDDFMTIRPDDIDCKLINCNKNISTCFVILNLC